MTTPTLPVLLKIGRDSLAVSLKGWCTASGKTWFYKKGESNVTLVGHIDTWHDKKSWGKAERWNQKTQKFEPIPESTKDRQVSLYYDNKRQTFWSPDGLGADDRAGVFLMIHAYNAISPKPNLLFTDLEESGGDGARDAAKEYAEELSESNLFIEWDRKGSNDAVFYRGESEEFRKYVCSFGYKEEKGSFTDVAILSRELEICGTNLSVGYYDQHTAFERLDVRQMWSSYSRGKKLILDASMKGVKWVNPRPPEPVGVVSTYYGGAYGGVYGGAYDDNDDSYYKCNYGVSRSEFWAGYDRSKSQGYLFGSGGTSGAQYREKEIRRATKRREKWVKKWAAVTEEQLNNDPTLRAQKDWEQTQIVEGGGARKIHAV